MRSMKFSYLFLVVLLVMVVTACKQPDADNKRSAPFAVGEHMKMVQFRLPSLTDNVVLDSKQLEGKVLLVNFFATWCPPCIQEVPTLISLQNSFKEEGFSVVAFSMDEGNPAIVRKFIEKYGISYPVLLAEPSITKGFGGVIGIPVSFLVNRRGEIVKKYIGYVEPDTLGQEIKNLLSEK